MCIQSINDAIGDEQRLTDLDEQLVGANNVVSALSTRISSELSAAMAVILRDLEIWREVIGLALALGDISYVSLNNPIID